MKFNNILMDDKTIKIPNYLNIFIESSRCCVCLFDHKDISRIIVNKKELNNISKNLNISLRTIYYWLKGERPISINKVFELEKLLGGGLPLKYYQFCNYTSMNGVKNKTKLPKYVGTRLAYLIGYILGDGYINIKGVNKKSYPFGITDISQNNIKIAVKPGNFWMIMLKMVVHC